MLQVLFEQWMQVGGKWDESQLIIQARTSHKGSKVGGRRWMMRQDIIKKYDGDVETADQLIASKEADPLLKKVSVRDHPDLPWRTDLRLFLIWDESYEQDSEDVVMDQLFSLGQKDSHGTKHKKGHTKKGKGKKRHRSSSSSSSASGSRSSSSSTDDSDQSSPSVKPSKKSKSKRDAKKNQKKTKKTKKAKKDHKKSSESSEGSSDSEVPEVQKKMTEAQKQKEEAKQEKIRQKEEEKAEKNRQKEEEKKQKALQKKESQEKEKEKAKTRASAKKACFPWISISDVCYKLVFYIYIYIYLYSLLKENGGVYTKQFIYIYRT